jgi:hypothetical protein
MRPAGKRLPGYLLAGLLLGSVYAAEPAVHSWPELTQSAKPWARWWWPGSAVERPQLTAQLEALAAAGIGGVEITPIYGARGYEDRYLEFLSPQWVAMLEHTTREAARLSLGVDMATGTGWPFGGPEVSAAQGSSAIALLDGRLTGKPTAMKVKRPAPGGEGLVLDPYAPDALAVYLQRFTGALKSLPAGALRAQFHDSFEYYNASWSPLLTAKFRELNGYDIQSYAAEIMGEKPLDADTLGRIKGDYRRTLAALHLEYVDHWVQWSHAQGVRARNQAHGAPGNLLDLYAAADIPETESFGMTQLPIVGMRVDAAGASIDKDPPLNLVGRFASSAAHVAGRPLASSETLTWLRENFRETPAAAKPQIDRLFIAGINHIFYHGVSYSPSDAPWPGWFFYAATQLNPNNPLWESFGAMNAYVGRVQAVLQAGNPDNDVLLYWPFDDLSDDPAGLMRQYGMHENAWLTESSTAHVALKLLDAGYTFDLVSDAQLRQLKVEGGALVAPGGRYPVLLVPAARRIPVATLARLQELARAGAVVVFESLPQDVPGFGHLEERRAQLRTLLADPALRAAVAQPDVATRLAQLGIRREPAAAAGLAFVRRARPEGHDYFFVNLGAKAFDGWLSLGTEAAAALLLDPLTGRSGKAATRDARGGSRAYLQLASGESAILRTFTARPQLRGTPAWRYAVPAAAGVPLAGEWQLTFVKGGPALPNPARLAQLGSWTELDDVEAQRFAGTARYRIQFDAPARHADEWLLDLGDVREAARVTLNGEPVGTAWSLPFRLRLGPLARTGNVLEIEVSNLPANRIRDLDVRKVDWKIMRDINLASIKYQALDASGWEVAPAGLLGPVTLAPLKLVSPN